MLCCKICQRKWLFEHRIGSFHHSFYSFKKCTILQDISRNAITGRWMHHLTCSTCVCPVQAAEHSSCQHGKHLSWLLKEDPIVNTLVQLLFLCSSPHSQCSMYCHHLKRNKTFTSTTEQIQQCLDHFYEKACIRSENRWLIIVFLFNVFYLNFAHQIPHALKHLCCFNNFTVLQNIIVSSSGHSQRRSFIFTKWNMNEEIGNSCEEAGTELEIPVLLQYLASSPQIIY